MRDEPKERLRRKPDINKNIVTCTTESEGIASWKIPSIWTAFGPGYRVLAIIEWFSIEC